MAPDPTVCPGERQHVHSRYVSPTRLLARPDVIAKRVFKHALTVVREESRHIISS